MIKARPCAGDIAAGEALLQRACAVHLAQISRLRRRRRRAGDEAADPRLSRPRRDRGRGPQHQARPRRHPRDRVLRADAATHRRRPPSGAARPRHAGDARRRSPRAAGSTPRRATISRRPIVSCAMSSTGCRWSPTSRLIPCRPTRGARAVRALSRLSRTATLLRRRCSAICARCSATTPSCSRDAPAPRPSRPALVVPREADDRETLDRLGEMGFQQAARGIGDGAALARPASYRSLKGEFARTPVRRTRAVADRPAVARRESGCGAHGIRPLSRRAARRRAAVLAAASKTPIWSR